MNCNGYNYSENEPKTAANLKSGLFHKMSTEHIFAVLCIVSWNAFLQSTISFLKNSLNYSYPSFFVFLTESITATTSITRESKSSRSPL